MPFLEVGEIPYSSFGVYFVGVTIALAIYGIVILQVIQYFRSFPSDGWGLKGTVLLMFVSETVNTAIQLFTTYILLIHWRGTLLEARQVLTQWSLSLPIAFNTFSGVILQFFFARRVWILSNRNRPLTTAILLLSVAQLATGWGAALLSLILENPLLNYSWVKINYAAFVTTAAADLLIACSLVYYLQIRKTGHPVTNSIVNKLIWTTINNGALPSAIAIGALIATLVAPASFFGFAFCSVLTKVYACTLVVSLNSRKSTRERLSRRALSTGAVAAALGTSNFPPPQGQITSPTGSDVYKLQRSGSASLRGVTITQEVTVTQD